MCREQVELAHAEGPGPYSLKAILSSDIKTDSSLKCVIFDPGGATGQIRRDLVNCVCFSYVLYRYPGQNELF